MKVKPLTVALGAASLLAAGLLGGWLGAQRLHPEHVAYTKGVTTPVATRTVPPAPQALQARLDQLADAYR